MLVGERVEGATGGTAAWDRGVGDTLATGMVEAKGVFESVGFGRGEFYGARVEGFGCAGAGEGNGRCCGDGGGLEMGVGMVAFGHRKRSKRRGLTVGLV